MLKNLPANAQMSLWSLGQEDPLEEEMATHSSILESDPKLTLKFHLEVPSKPPPIPHLYYFILNPALLLSPNPQHNSQNTIFVEVRAFFKNSNNSFLFYIEI